MSDELREAAERRRKPYPRASVSGGKDYVAPWVHKQEWSDMNKLADAYLDEHPADDDTPIDEAWLKSIANDCEREHDGDIAAWFDTSLNQLSLSKSESSSMWNVSVMDTTDGDESASLPPITTRGQLRRLCSALGIELKEGK